MPCVEEIGICMHVPNVMHVSVDCLCKRMPWYLNVKILSSIQILSVIDWAEAS